MHGILPMRDVAPSGRTAAERALALDPSNEQPRFVLAGIAPGHDLFAITGGYLALALRRSGRDAEADRV